MSNIDEIENNLREIDYSLSLRTSLPLESFGAGNYHTSYRADIISCDGRVVENESYEYIGKLDFNLNHMLHSSDKCNG